jgi:general secretion pathway protein L
MRPRDGLVVIDVGASGITVYRTEGRRCRELGRVARRGAADEAAPARAGHTRPAALLDLLPVRDKREMRVLVRIPGEEILARTVELPPAAGENLREVLAFEMHRFTPFQAREVHFEYRVLSGPPDFPALVVKLECFRREGLDEVLAMLAQSGLVLGARVEPGALDLDGLFLALERPVEPRPMRTLLRRTLAVANVALLIALLAIPFARENARLAELRARVASTKVEAQAAGALRQQLDSLIAQRRLLIERKRRAPSTIEVLSELSAVLPDGTWLRRFELKHGEVQIEGSSSGASALVGLIEQTPMFAGASFQSPVIRTSTNGEERFKLAFEVAPRGESNDDQTGYGAEQSAGAAARGAGPRRAL